MALRNGEASFNDLALAAYGEAAKGNTANKLRRLLERMEAEGLIRTTGDRMWSIA